jgi:hypothetical protein
VGVLVFSFDRESFATEAAFIPTVSAVAVVVVDFLTHELDKIRITK